MSTTLATLKQRLQTLIGDKDGIYSGKYTDAINEASRDIYPILHKPLMDDTLIGENILPPFHWASSSTLDFYTEPTGTLAKTTTAGYYRHSPISAKVIANGADDALVLDSNAYPRLLDIMDKTVSLKCWALAQDANDSKLDIVTTDSTGSDTTQSSTTTSTAGVFTLIKIEDYAVPDDITRVQIKLRVHTDTKYAYFDPPRLTGKTIYQYVLPYDFQKGHVSQVRLQSSGYSDNICDDLHPQYSIEVFGWNTPTENGVQYLDFTQASRKPYANQRIQLIGYCPLEDDLSSDTDTITLDTSRIPLLIAKAASSLYQRQRGVVSSDDIEKYEREVMWWEARVRELTDRHRMSKPQSQSHWR